MISIPYHVYCNAAVTTAGLQTFQAIADGFIVGLQLQAAIGATTAADTQMVFEVSFQSGGLGYNQDSRSIIAKMMVSGAFTAASEGAQTGPPLNMFGLRVPWAVGERLYVNLGTITANSTVYLTGVIWQEVDDRAFARPGMRLN